MKQVAFSLFALTILIGCGGVTETNQQHREMEAGTYGYDSAFLKEHTHKVLELKSEDGAARVLLSADYQGRVMTSTASGAGGNSFGWLNYELIASKEWKPQFNPVGGEERFWLGPEGGQFSIYFDQGTSFDIENWQVPGIIDTIAYSIVTANESEAVFSASAKLTNYSGSGFDLDIRRSIRMLSGDDLSVSLGTGWSNELKWVAYESINSITNAGNEKWSKEKGLLSIWLLGMFSPSPETTVIIPFKPIEGAKEYITSNYFGEIPDERLVVTDSVVYFQCDGQFRSKLGLSPIIAKSLAASFDFKKNILTVIKFPVMNDGYYVNAKWEMQENPYQGDVVNSYNDGPLSDGSQLGPFYEIESSSPAQALAPGESQVYRQITCHFEGEFAKLNELAKTLLGVNLAELPKQ